MQFTNDTDSEEAATYQRILVRLAMLEARMLHTLTHRLDRLEFLIDQQRRSNQ